MCRKRNSPNCSDASTRRSGRDEKRSPINPKACSSLIVTHGWPGSVIEQLKIIGVGHLHITVDDLPWLWADFGQSNTIVLAGMPRGQHKVLIELGMPKATFLPQKR